MMNRGYRELGTGIRYGEFSRLNSIMVAESFGNRGGDYFVTGVAYTDAKVKDDFYTIGESLGSITVVATRNRDGMTYSTTTGPSGGYSLQVPAGVYTVTARGAGISGTMTVENVGSWVATAKSTLIRGHPDWAPSVVCFSRTRTGTVFTTARSLCWPTVTSFIDADDDGVHDPDETSVQIDAQGVYRFANLRAGAFSIRQELPPGWQASESLDRTAWTWSWPGAKI